MAKNKPKIIRVREIVQAAVKLFLEHGYENTSMESIARGAGLTKGGLYHHFSSKDEILLAANQVYFEPVLALTQRAIESDDPVQGLLTFIDQYLGYWKEHPQDITFWNLSMTKVAENPQYWPMMETYTNDMVGFYSALLESGIKKGRLRPHKVEPRAKALMAALDGAAFYTLFSPQFRPELIQKDFTEIFLKDIIRSQK